MAKRNSEPETADVDPVPEMPSTVGDRLRLAREGQKLSLEDVAAQTRIPLRHLASIEASDWDSLPAPTYTVGFAKNYAGAVGLDRTEIGEQLREEMGGQRFAATSADVFEPADPRRTMPKSLVIGTVIAAILLIALFSILNRRSLEQPDEATTNAATAAPSAPTTPTPAPVPNASQAVVLAATAPAWIQVTDQGKTLFQGELQPGQNYTVPPTATAPMLKAGKPEALNVTVGTTAIPQVGPSGKVTTVSLLPADLLRAPSTATPAPAPAPAAGPATAPLARQRTTAKPAQSTPPAPATAPPPVEAAPTNQTGQ
jgi:cytoskeletal protein RodZ